MIEAARQFAGWFAATFTLPWWAFSVALVGAALAYRLLRVLTAERREARRRHELLSDLKEFIGGAHRENVKRAQELHFEKLLRHATIHVLGRPVTTVREATGIGRATTDALVAAGYRTLGDIQARDIRAIRAIGQVKFDAARRLIHTEIEAAKDRLAAGARDIPLDPDTEASYNEAIALLGVRNERLVADHQGLQPAADEVAAYEARAAQRTADVRIREWLRSPLDTIRSNPTRSLRFLSLFALFVAIVAGLPHVVLGWNEELSASTASASVGAAYFAINFFLAVYAFASERAVRLGTRPLDPSNYWEQRLQYLGLMMALARGIAPPEVRITRAAVTETRGNRVGPSLIAVADSEVKHLSRDASHDAVEFLLAHQIGELSGDHQRVRATTATLLAPFAWAAHGTVRGAAMVFGSIFQPQASGLAAIALCCLFVPFVAALPLTVAVVCIYLAVAVVRVVLSTESVFDADRTARELTSADAMITALRALSDKKRVDDAVTVSAAIDLLLREEPPPRHVRAARWINSHLDALANLRPSLRRRLRVIDHPIVPVVETGTGVLRAAAILAVAFVGLSLAGRQLHWMAHMLTRPARPISTAAVSASSSPTQQAEQPRVTRRINVRGDATSCVVRSSPSVDGRVLGRAHTGTTCDVRAYDEHWVDAMCGGVAGFVGRGCVEDPP